MVGVTSQGSEQEKSAEVRIKPGQQQDRNRNRMQEQDTGPRKNTHQGRVCRSGHPLNTPV
ncbi:unnamed protein product [Staurois parvus]|uniref:Uncharacterized protein n=1 Tax=Staurois parvus TaxID=386267 RepID=A0ABN9D2M6_9NEOB|nr:unnamed protein product [Staurois parvus]CAI9590764.1 unnamed protein product [Staurois parvus]CAI9622165.1 unnamed protein product [Staurois parvus]